MQENMENIEYHDIIFCNTVSVLKTRPDIVIHANIHGSGQFHVVFKPPTAR